MSNMSDEEQPRWRRIVFLAGLLVALCAVVAVLLFGRRPPPRAAAGGDADNGSAARAAQPSGPRTLPTVVANEQAEEAPANPIIDEIRVEKQEVCEGEENLITVKAHTPVGRDDAFLHYVINGTPGQSIPVRAILPAEGQQAPAPRRIQVFGRGDAVTSVDIPPYTIKKCHPDRMLLLAARQMPNSTDEMELVATVQESGPSAPLRVSSYRWSFGDGTTTSTATASVVHRFEPRNPDALISDFLVACEAVGKDGRTVMGRKAISLRNLEFENLAFHKTLVLSVEMTPRFPELDSRGQITQRVRLFHHHNAPVRLERAIVSYRTAGGQAGAPEETHTAAELLGTEAVSAGPGVESAFHLDTKAHPDVVMVDYVFEGRTADGIKAEGAFSIMVPPALPTPETSPRVMDSVLTQKILIARERLGKPFVNDEDLRQLEQAGAFADLKAPAAPSAPVAEEGAPEPEPPPAVLEAAMAAKRPRPR